MIQAIVIIAILLVLAMAVLFAVGVYTAWETGEDNDESGDTL